MQYHPTVLLIDDDTDDQEIFSHAMEKANDSAQCIFANDGIQALEKIMTDESFVPDYIFIDMNMPRMNGQQCLTEIKKINRLKNVPVYMYSTSADPQSLEENKRLGAMDFIVKPSNIQDLVTILKSIVQKPVIAVLLLMAALGAFPASVSGQDTLTEINELKKLTVEELMNIVITSVSKTPENLEDAASAIQVITGYDIKRSAATRLPEALRLAPNLQVFQTGSHDWAVTSRGFNGAPVANTSLADKLLVMIDGRAVYTPLFGGVFWDVQNVLLEDVDRIEVISGPGGTLWGANAVNGVVNIMSKSAKETQGFFGNATYGSVLRDHFALRYGGQVDSALYFRVYGQRFDSENSLLADGSDARDSWNRTTGGFRMDYIPNESQSFTLQGEMYAGEEDDTLKTLVNGQHIITRWNKTFSEHSSLTVQAYADRTWRDIRNRPFTDEMLTLDMELDHSFYIGDHNLLWGAGYRYQDDETTSFDNRFTPADKTLQLWSGFIQDQFALVPEKMNLTIGSKILHNDFTGFELQPSIRLAFIPEDQHTLWAAVSRAVRTPSRFDVELTSFAHIERPAFVSEKVIAYELGYRMRPNQKISFSVATFYNQYTDLRTFNFSEDNVLYFANDMDAQSWGLEVSGTVLVSNWWRVRGGYTYLDKDFTIHASNVFPGNDILEANDPKNQMILQSIMDISDGFQVDVVARLIDELTGLPEAQLPNIPSYVNLNLRLGWEYKFMTVSLVGQNLLEEANAEFGRRQIPRSAYANIKIRL